MSAAGGVPVTRDEIRPVLEALRELATDLWLTAEDDSVSVACAKHLKDACTAALADGPRAGEGERASWLIEFFDRRTGAVMAYFTADDAQEWTLVPDEAKKYSTPESAEAARQDLAGRSLFKQLRVAEHLWLESAPAPARERDPELDGLLTEFVAEGATCEHDSPGSRERYDALRRAIHAYVAKVKRAAREAVEAEWEGYRADIDARLERLESAPAPGDATGETASGETEKDFAKALWDLRESCRLFGEARIRNARRGASEEAAREHNDALDRAKRDWDEVVRLYRAASGPDAGTGERARSMSEDATGTHMDAPSSRPEEQVRIYAARHGAPLSGPTNAAASSPAPASGAAPEERDGVLDDLLNALTGCVDHEGNVVDDMESRKAAIHAHVERVKREAREAGSLTAAGNASGTDTDPRQRTHYVSGDATGETASGETHDDFEAALRDYVEAAITHRRFTAFESDYAEVRGKCELARQRVLRLYRAAAGEVVGSATVEMTGHHSATITASELRLAQDAAPVMVDLVRRRGKEEG